MKRIKPEELPKDLNEEVIDILAKMANEVPQSEEWHKIFDILSPPDLRKIMDRKLEIQKEQEKLSEEKISDKEKSEEEVKWKRIQEETDPHKFYGNMGQPDTPKEFKNRYGVWPPGYDENGNKK